MNRNFAQTIKIALILLSLAGFISAQKGIVPIVYFDPSANAGKEFVTNGTLLGGVQNGKYLDAKTTFGKVKTDDKFLLFDFDGSKKGEFVLGAFQAMTINYPDNYYVEPQLKISAKLALGTNANWKIFPRLAKKGAATDAVYKKSVADVLRLHGLSKSPVKITQAFRVDLDGDGADEVILEALYSTKNDADEGTSRGSYSCIIIRKTVGGKVRNLLVDGYFLSKKDDEAEGDFLFAGVADLNGDGKLELIVDAPGYEEYWVKVYEIKGGKSSEIGDLSYHWSV